MGSGVGSTSYLKLTALVLLLSSSRVAGFALRVCRVTDSHLLCAGYELQSVPQDMPPTLTSADLSSNKLRDIKGSDFKNLDALTQLDLNRNLISQVDEAVFADLISLQKLNLNNNKLRRLGNRAFYGLNNLTELRLHGNKIQTIASSSFMSLGSLTFLDLNFNNLERLAPMALALQHLPQLQSLWIRKNRLKSFQSWELTNSSLELTALDLAENPLQVFRVTADVFPKLKWLNIGGPTRKERMVWDVPDPAFMQSVSTLDIGGLNLDHNDAKALLGSFNSSLGRLRMTAMRKNLQLLINMSCTIPTLTSLQLWRNNLKNVRPEMFQLCVNLTDLDLAVNRIESIDNDTFTPLRRLRVLSLSRNSLQSVPVALRKLSLTLSELDLSSNKLSSLNGHDFASLTRLRRLNLYQNTISALNSNSFQNLSSLLVLKLQNNSITSLNGAFKEHLSNLQVLLLDRNKLSHINPGEFAGLRSLQNLTLRENQLSFLQNGSFLGLTALTDLQLQTNKLTENSLSNCVFCNLVSLRRLDLRDNHVHYKDSLSLPQPPFAELKRLERLSIPGQHHKGKARLPVNFLQGLTNLRVFEARNILLLHLPPGMFNYTPRLEQLDISSNELAEISPQLFWPLPNLKSLSISRTNMRSLDFLVEARLMELEFLQSKKNVFSVINIDVIQSLPRLQYLDLQGNSFTCDCDNAGFLQWVVGDNHTQVYDAYNFTCNYPPNMKNTKLLDLDVRSCSVDMGLIYFASTSSALLLFMMASFIYHFLRWQLAYAYHLLLANLFERRRGNRRASAQYDAFISYNTHDEAWVVQELLPKLEGEQGWRLCLHHRDFLPGKPIMDNITDAIYGSRNTICVISRRYLESEWCSREIQVASFRLFDERKDVLILVFLEEIPMALLSPFYRMRKLLKKWTYLSWPKAGHSKQVFWEKLRQALVSREDPDEEQLRLTVINPQR